MESLTYSQLISAAAVILIMIGAYNTIMTALKNHREQKRIRESPLTELSNRIEHQGEAQARDHEHLERLDGQLSDIEAQTRILLRGVKAMLSHELNGNSVDKLRESLSEIDDYLINR